MPGLPGDSGETGPQGPPGETGPNGITYGSFFVGDDAVVRNLTTAGPTNVIDAASASGNNYVTVTLNMDAGRSDVDPWVGYVACSFTGVSGVTSSTATTRVLFDGGPVQYFGSQLVVQAVIEQLETGTLSCVLVDDGADDADDPNVEIRVAGAMGFSVNTSISTYASFAYAGPA